MKNTLVYLPTRYWKPRNVQWKVGAIVHICGPVIFNFFNVCSRDCRQKKAAFCRHCTPPSPMRRRTSRRPSTGKCKPFSRKQSSKISLSRQVLFTILDEPSDPLSYHTHSNEYTCAHEHMNRRTNIYIYIYIYIYTYI